MKLINSTLLFLFVLLSASVSAQENQQKETAQGHENENPFRQLYQVFSTPNQYRTASGAPGPAYYQNTADYVMDLTLDDKNQRIHGYETITYTNNSPDELRYLWVQLDQNIRAKDSKAPLRNSEKLPPVVRPESFVSSYMEDNPFDGGFKLEEVSKDGKALHYTINQTMMRIDLEEPLKAGDSFEFSIKWWYNINNYVKDGGRSGYEYFKEDGNYLYVIAQFFPRMAVYNDKEGWQNYQFWGAGEFALPFGSYKVSITVPADHVLGATGALQNRKEVYSDKMMERYEKAKKSFDKPVVIVTQEEAETAEKNFSEATKTWIFKADKVRDFAFATSRKFIVDMMNVKIDDQEVMAISMYPKEGNPLWGDYSTLTVAHTLKTFSEHTFTYPYPKAISVHAKDQGMEYPMISWNHGRPNEDGSYSDQTKFGMIGVIIHEVGHNFFPMIVNSDERQWGWMDEGLNTFLEYLTQKGFGEKYPNLIAPLETYPLDRGKPVQVIDYMSRDQRYLEPIMTNPEQIHSLGGNAYGKVTAALSILRETVMGPELFDYAFKTYSQRWMFKHPTPEDFFRTMEDASGIDLDWFWRGWFYSTDVVDMGIAEVNVYRATNTPTEAGKTFFKRYGINDPNKNQQTKDAIYFEKLSNQPSSSHKTMENTPKLQTYLSESFSEEERGKLKSPAYFYEVVFENPGGLVMPLIVEYTYADGTSEKIKYPVQVWRKNHEKVRKVIPTDQPIISIVVDPELMTADVNTGNNSWPKN